MTDPSVASVRLRRDGKSTQVSDSGCTSVPWPRLFSLTGKENSPTHPTVAFKLPHSANGL